MKDSKSLKSQFKNFELNQGIQHRVVSLTNKYFSYNAKPKSNAKQNSQALERFDIRCNTVFNPGYDYDIHVGKKKRHMW